MEPFSGACDSSLLTNAYASQEQNFATAESSRGGRNGGKGGRGNSGAKAKRNHRILTTHEERLEQFNNVGGGSGALGPPPGCFLPASVHEMHQQPQPQQQQPAKVGNRQVQKNTRQSQAGPPFIHRAGPGAGNEIESLPEQSLQQALPTGLQPQPATTSKVQPHPRVAGLPMQSRGQQQNNSNRSMMKTEAVKPTSTTETVSAFGLATYESDMSDNAALYPGLGANLVFDNQSESDAEAGEDDDEDGNVGFMNIQTAEFVGGCYAFQPETEVAGSSSPSPARTGTSSSKSLAPPPRLPSRRDKM
jgi:hypothetical protein